MRTGEMTTDVEAFAARLAAEWYADPHSGSCPVARWLAQFGDALPRTEPDTCADGVSRMPCGDPPIRWYDDGERLSGFWVGRRCYQIPWRDIELFLHRFITCEDDELPPEPDVLPLAG